MVKKEKYFPSKLENSVEKTEEEIIKAPEGCYFIHGVTNWTKDNSIGIRTPEISCSLQKDEYTRPLKPYGYILQLTKGSIISAYDRDVASKYNDNSFTKSLSWQTNQKKLKNYSEENLDILIANTRQGNHNELFVKGEKVEIVGAYVDKSKSGSAGIKVFIKACKSENIQIHYI